MSSDAKLRCPHGEWHIIKTGYFDRRMAGFAKPMDCDCPCPTQQGRITFESYDHADIEMNPQEKELRKVSYAEFAKERMKKGVLHLVLEQMALDVGVKPFYLESIFWRRSFYSHDLGELEKYTLSIVAPEPGPGWGSVSHRIAEAVYDYDNSACTLRILNSFDINDCFKVYGDPEDANDKENMAHFILYHLRPYIKLRAQELALITGRQAW